MEGEAERIITLCVSKGTSGRFYVGSPDIGGLVVGGADINEALSEVEQAVSALATAGCRQAQAVLDRANAWPPRVSPPQLHAVPSPGAPAAPEPRKEVERGPYVPPTPETERAAAPIPVQAAGDDV